VTKAAALKQKEHETLERQEAAQKKDNLDFVESFENTRTMKSY
jgi:hypothetical protein